MKTRAIILCLALLAAAQPGAQPDAQAQNVENFRGRVTIPLKHGSDHPGRRTDPEMNRWRGHGLGQFIHWGIYSIPGGEWEGKTMTGAAEWIRAWREMPKADYDNLYKQFNPKGFDARKWARMAREMGAGYVVFTTKHHDGFCMWPSRYTDYDVESTPYKKDIVRQVVDAYTAEGIDVRLYFSVMDWCQGGWLYAPPQTDEERAKWEGFKAFTRNQILELLERYPTIKGLWFDGTWDKSWVGEYEFAHELELEIRAKHQGIIIGSRFRPDEHGNRQFDANGDLLGDYDQSWERDIPTSIEQLRGNDWDCAMTIAENGWGYAKTWTSYVKTPYELISMISECNSMGGNLVLNFGPDGNGEIRPEEVHIAAEIGRWMGLYGEAVRETEPVTDIRKQGWGFMTRRGNKLYLHVYNVPINNILRVEFGRKTYVPGAVRMLGGGEDSQRTQKNYGRQKVSNSGQLKVTDAGRNKRNSRLFNIHLPEGAAADGPFVVELDLIDNTGETDAYQQALT